VKPVEQRVVEPLAAPDPSAHFDARRLGPRWPPYETSAAHPLTDTVEWRSRPGPSDDSAVTAPRWVSPTLVLLAAASILEGYRWLNMIPAEGWQPSAVVFVAVVLPLAVVLARPRRDGRRVEAAKVVAVASVILLVVTASALVVDRASLTHLMGAADLLFAITALGAVLANERFFRRGA
jgi:hypothetical protein